MGQSEYDPRLEQKIEAIKKNLRGGSDQNHSNSHTKAEGAATDDTNLRNYNKLEEVLHRQRERLEAIQNQFPKEELKQGSPMRSSEGIQS